MPEQAIVLEQGRIVSAATGAALQVAGNVTAESLLPPL